MKLDDERLGKYLDEIAAETIDEGKGCSGLRVYRFCREGARARTYFRRPVSAIETFFRYSKQPDSPIWRFVYDNLEEKRNH